MSGFEEEQEEEMFQMETDQSEAPISISPPNHQPSFLSLQEILGKHTNEEVEIHEKILMYMKDVGTTREDYQGKNLKNFVVMKLKTDGYQASICETSWVSTCKLSRGVYQYIDVMMVDNTDGKPKRLILDVDFRSQFELSRPTTAYKELINSLPLIFVGTEEKLGKVIPLLCSAAKQSLKEVGLHIPPWRKTSYMHSKWLSKNCKKLSV